MKREVCLACLASLNLLLLELTVHYTEAKFNSKCLVSTTGGTMYQAFFFCMPVPSHTTSQKKVCSAYVTPFGTALSFWVFSMALSFQLIHSFITSYHKDESLIPSKAQTTLIRNKRTGCTPTLNTNVQYKPRPPLYVRTALASFLRTKTATQEISTTLLLSSQGGHML